MDSGDFTGPFEGGLHQDYMKKRPGRKSDMPSWYAHYLDMWDIIKQAECTSDDDKLMQYQRQLKKTHHAFMVLIDAWLEKKKQALPETLTPEDRHIKMRAEEIRRKFEKGLFRYALVYMYLNRYLILMRMDLQALMKHVPRRTTKNNLQINDNLGFLLRRAYREKAKYVHQKQKIERIETLLHDITPLFSTLQKDLIRDLGTIKGKRAFTAFRGHIRHCAFDKAHTMALHWRFAKPVAADILDLYKTHMEDLKIQNQSVLEASDLKLMMSFTAIAEQRIDTFIRKYSLPFLDYKFKMLLKQAVRLGQIGNFESLFMAYEKIIYNMAHPMTDERLIRDFDSEVLQKIEFKMRNGFPMLTDILDQSEEAVHELRALLAAIRTLT